MRSVRNVERLLRRIRSVNTATRPTAKTITHSTWPGKDVTRISQKMLPGSGRGNDKNNLANEPSLVHLDIAQGLRFPQFVNLVTTYTPDFNREADRELG